jgi:hypothetical protein
MSLFYFDVADANPPIPCVGVELSSIAEARGHALKYAGQLLFDQDPEFWNSDEWIMTVSDETHLTLCTLTISASNAPATMEVRIGLR